jgi:hypothetical protein
VVVNTADALDHMASELGNSSMGTHVTPLLDGPPDRRIGAIIATVSA